MAVNLYTSGDYLKKNPTWHSEEAQWKASKVARMIARNQITPETVCDVGCGTGEVIRQLEQYLHPDCLLWGYDISPQALELARARTGERLHFKLADITQEQGVFFDLILLMDVIEHLEDYFSFLRQVQAKSTWKILHIPLDLSVQTVLRRRGLLNVRDAYGHLHYFTKELALRIFDDVGYEVLDYAYTARAIEEPTRLLRRNLMKLPRRAMYVFNQDFAAHLLGGWSLLVLAK